MFHVTNQWIESVTRQPVPGAALNRAPAFGDVVPQSNKWPPRIGLLQGPYPRSKFHRTTHQASAKVAR
jgi:hypothetical protein